MDTSVIATIFLVLAKTLSLYSFLLIVRVLLSWFPNLDWSNPFLSLIGSITDPYLNVFRGIIPPLGGLDLSAILAFISLSLLEGSFVKLASLPLFNGGMGYYG